MTSPESPKRYSFAEPGSGGCFIPRGSYLRSMEILKEATDWYGALIDDRLTVSPEVMACLEADFPDAARQFRVDPIRRTP